MGHQAPLHCQVFRFVNGKTFVDAPAYRKVIEHYILLPVTPASQAVAIQVIPVSYPYTDITDNHIAGIHHQRIIFQADTISRSRLSRYGNTVIDYAKWRLQFNGTIYSKDYYTGSPLLHRIAETAFTAVIQIRNGKDTPAPSAGGIFAIPFSTRKGYGLCLHASSRQKQAGGKKEVFHNMHKFSKSIYYRK